MARAPAIATQLAWGAAAVVSAVMVGAVMSVLSRSPVDDGFPLSTYPMFGTQRPSRLTMTYAVGVTGAGERVAIPPVVVTGSWEVMQAYSTLSRIGARRGSELRAACDEIAARVAQHEPLRDVVEVQIVSGTHDAVALVTDGVRGTERVRVQCPITK